jgi:hypothetical protein
MKWEISGIILWFAILIRIPKLWFLKGDETVEAELWIGRWIRTQKDNMGCALPLNSCHTQLGFHKLEIHVSIPSEVNFSSRHSPPWPPFTGTRNSMYYETHFLRSTTRWRNPLLILLLASSVAVPELRIPSCWSLSYSCSARHSE